MALNSGVYTITNLKNNNWAVLTNDNDDDNVVSGFSGDLDAGETWIINNMSNFTYFFRNKRHGNYASYRWPSDNLPTVLSKRTATPKAWKIDRLDDGNSFVIFTIRGDLCWSLPDNEPGTPISLKEYNRDPNQHWKINAKCQPSRVRPLCSVRRVLSLDSYSGISSLTILDHLMKALAVDTERPPAPCEVFDLICGVSSGGIIAILLGRLGLTCQDALKTYLELRSIACNETGSDPDEFFWNRFKDILERYGETKDTLMKTDHKLGRLSKTTKTFIATRPHHDNVIYRIRSYPTPRLEVDSPPIGYKWPVWEAAKGTCAVQPSSTPIRIFRHSIPYRFGDPSSHGHSNPAISAIQEANKLFPDEVVLLASIGTGAPIQDIDSGSHNSIDQGGQAQTPVETAEKTHQEILKKQLLPESYYFRLNPVPEVEDMTTKDPQSLGYSTHRWLQSPNSKLVIEDMISKMLGVPNLRPPPPPPDTNKGYNPVLDAKRPEDMCDYLRDYDIIFLIDDSRSMSGQRWRETQHALCGIAKKAMDYKVNGVEIQFLNSKLQRVGVKDIRTMEGIFNEVRPSPGTPTAKRLSDILQIHIARLDDALGRREEYSKIKPLDLIIITDGEASDDPKNVLVKIAAELKPKKHHPNIIGIQFVQIGEDQKARKELRTIARAEVANMVDTVPYSSELTPERLERILLGGLHPNVRALFAD